MKFDTPATDQPDRPAEGHRQAASTASTARSRPPARRPMPMSSTTSRRTRPMATSSARPSPRAASPRWTSPRPRPRPACSRSSPPRMPASSARASCNTAKLLGGPEIEHYHQAIALVVAETLRAGARRRAAGPGRLCRGEGRVRSRCGARTARRSPTATSPSRRPRSATSPAPSPPRRSSSTRTYTTPDQSHAMMEPHASIAAWDGDKLTLWTSNQMIAWSVGDLAKTLGIPKEKVRLISPYHRRRLRRQAVPARRRAAGGARRHARPSGRSRSR